MRHPYKCITCQRSVVNSKPAEILSMSVEMFPDPAGAVDNWPPGFVLVILNYESESFLFFQRHFRAS